VFTLPVTVAATAPNGKQNLTVEVYFQTCNDRMCIPPNRVKVQVPLTLTGGTAAGAQAQQPTTNNTAAPGAAVPNAPELAAASTSSNQAAPNTAAPAPAGDISLSAEAATAAAKKSLGGFLLAAAGFALLSLLTPCVFPIIPITVSYFTKQAEEHKGSAIGSATVFSLGIIGTYTIGGFLIARLAGAGGINKFAASPWTTSPLPSSSWRLRFPCSVRS
jgi:thiol:disulfide interchange protein DsbD